VNVLRKLAAPLVLAVLVAPAAARAAGGHEDQVGPLLLALAVIIVAAKLGGEVATRAGQPAVLGELLAGVALGNVGLLGWSGLASIQDHPGLEALANLGVLLLLFEVGLESTVAEMLQVGPSALLVAVIGVVVPFGLGWGAGAVLLPAAGTYVHLFLGATLCATSVGITARVLHDLGRARSGEARVIIGAAVVDDVLGLVILAVVSGVIGAQSAGREISIAAVAAIVGKAIVFLVGALAIGARGSPLVFRLGARFQSPGVLLTLGLAFCFALSWLAGAIGLAPIVGAFAAGLVLESVHYRHFVDRGEHGLEELVRPIAAFLVPIFFVVMGMRTDLRSLADLRALGLAAALTIAAVAGKQACGLGVRGAGIDRLTVGIGMIPRGEVGLIFANLGLSLSIGDRPLLDGTTYSAIVLVVIATTLMTPPALRWSLRRVDRAANARGAPASHGAAR
jgi:Kef-type K+ transport system membrane component KefB